MKNLDFEVPLVKKHFSIKLDMGFCSARPGSNSVFVLQNLCGLGISVNVFKPSFPCL